MPRSRGRWWVGWLAVATLGVVPSRGESQSFRLGLEGPEEIHPNELIEVGVTLTSSDVPFDQRGVEGWQLGVVHENLELIDLSLDGTVAAGLGGEGFASIRAAAEGDLEGFVSVVALSLREQGTALPSEGTSLLARARYIVGTLACQSGARVRFRDEDAASGGVFLNRVSQNGASHVPEYAEATWTRCAGPEYTLSLASGDDPLRVRGDGSDLITISVVLEQAWPTARSWDLAVSHDPSVLALVDVTVDGTDAAESFADDGFAVFEATGGAGNVGFVAQLSLSLEQPAALGAPRQTIALATYRVRPVELPPEGALRTDLRLVESLRGSGGPVFTRVRPEGVLSLRDQLAVWLTRRRGEFVRGDVNLDSLVDLTDSIVSLEHQFLGEPARLACPRASDVDDGGTLEITDAILLLEHLFLGGPPPLPPHPACGLDSTPDALGCDTLAGCER